VAFLQQKANEYFPQGMTYDFQGESRQFVTEGNTLAYTFLFALIVIYLVLAAQFESFRDPFIILIGLPASMFGALFFLFIMGEVNGMMQGASPINLGSGTINIYTQIGLVTLIGLISKHGILMVEFANKLQEEQNYDKFAAIKEAAAVRLRPILMTTAAMVIGVVPLLIAAGAGAKSRFDIGLVIAAGMTIGTMFTLFITPVVYTYIAADRRPKEALAAGGVPALAGVPPVMAEAANDRDREAAVAKAKKQRRPPTAEAAE
jgi:multidrug efflux pump subunit AcrB